MAVSCWITSSPLQKFPPLSTSSFQLQTSYHHLRLHSCSSSINFLAEPLHCSNRVFRKRFLRHSRDLRVRCNSETPSNLSGSSDSTSIQVYRDFERLVTETVKQSQDAWGGASNWSEVEGAWVLGPTHSKPWSIVHFIGGIFVGAAPQLAYRSFLERLCEKGILVIATPYASGFDHFSIADEVQFKFDRCLRSLQETVGDLPTFGIGHSLGSVVHLLIGSRYAVQRNGNVFMAFNNKDPSQAIPLFSPIFLPMTQRMGPLLSQIASSETVRLGGFIFKLTKLVTCVIGKWLLDVADSPPVASQYHRSPPPVVSSPVLPVRRFEEASMKSKFSSRVRGSRRLAGSSSTPSSSPCLPQSLAGDEY
ncbi:hypothetical protein SOVF_098050 isoform B [Spinacia oleracea]|nr:hypothetical protein SOVF_098050 isoform B [Spinacia oleracea]